jgi:CheY-like chemotaxis protein
MLRWLFAENGRAAVDKFASIDIDLVLMDLEMPVMDGYAATRKIREHEAQRGGRGVPILAFTSFAGEEYFQRSWDAGCNAHLIKPMDKASLLDAIQQHLKTRGTICIVVPDELKDLAPRYLKSRRADLVALAAALDKGDYEAIRVLGHNLKGTGSGYGFAGITVIGRCLEFAAKAKSPDQVRAQTAALSDYLDRVEVV